jgi:hypothetical protein
VGATLRWVARRCVDGPGVVYFTRLHLRRFRDIPAFFRDSMAIRGQARRSAGARSLVMEARPLARTFLTVSWWDDEPSVRAFVRADPHRAAMRRWHAQMAEFGNERFPGTPGVVPTVASARAALSPEGA